MKKESFYKIQLLIVGLLICAGSFFYLLRTVSDTDFFWHLKTGQWIWEHKQLPEEDPFSFTTRHGSSREHSVLTAYWLCQVLYYLCFKSGGMYGIVLMRFFVMAMLIHMMIMRKKGDNLLYGALLLIFIIMFLEGYPIERPHVFSMLLFGVLLFLLEGLKATDRLTLGRIIAIPLLMTVWSNIHIGHLLGQLTILLFIVTESVKFFHPSLRPVDKIVYFRLLTAGIVGIAFSFLNPNTYHAIIEAPIVFDEIGAFIIELESSFRAVVNYRYHYLVLYWLIFILVVADYIFHWKEIDITEFVLVVGLGTVSFFAIRFAAFFMVAALPVVGRSYSGNRLLQLSRIIIFSISVAAALFFGGDELANIDNIKEGAWISRNELPVDAAEFIASNDIKGNMYNDFNWGGYLIWRLAPEKKVFIDSRIIDPSVYRQAVLVDNAYVEEGAGIRVWKSILEKYEVRYIVIPYLQRDREKSPLASELLKEREWIPVFFRYNTIIFIKDSPENSHVVRPHSQKNFIGRHF